MKTRCPNALARALRDYKANESIEYAELVVDVVSLEEAYRNAEADTLSTALDNLAASNGTPWAVLEAAKAQAREDWVEAEAADKTTRDTDLANAARDR